MQQIVLDLHLHSRYSRAVSQEMTLTTMARVGRQKGLDVLSASDWTHPLWLKEIRTQLEDASEGLYQLKKELRDSNREEPLFLLSTEIASIGNDKGKLRRIHNLVFAPSFTVAEKIQKELIKRGCNLSSDGRPIIGLSSKQLLELILSIDQGAMLIPCHVWTPHFGIYGSASGYDSLLEAFDGLSEYIYGIETGLSSDPEMNWQMEELKYRSILSFSDAHSPAKMGREATVLLPKNEASKKQITYEDIRQAIMRTSSDWKIGYTIEFYPEEGKYHFSGHRNCKVIRDPEQTKKEGNRCPVCRKKLTEGVLYRVEQLASSALQGRAKEKMGTTGTKWYTDTLQTQPPYVKLVPLLEIVAESLGSTVASQKSKDLFANLCDTFGSEIDVLLLSPIDEIKKVGGERLSDGIRKVRAGGIAIDPGYDGEYGKVKIWENEEKRQSKKKASSSSQEGLF